MLIHSFLRTATCSSLAAIVISVSVFALTGCNRYSTNASTAAVSIQNKSEVSAATPGTRSEDKPKASVTISSLAVYGWWWSDEQFANNFDADNPPPKESYFPLNKWDASQPDSPHPRRVDIVCRLKNNTSGQFNVSLQAFADFKVASYPAIARGSGSQSRVDEKLRQVKWTDNRKLGGLTITLLPGEDKEVKFKDFDLGAVTERYLKPTAGDLWPWKFRLTVVVKTHGGLSTYSHAIIDLIPGD